MACSTVNGVCITLPHACMWSISIDRSHGPLSPCCHCPHASQAGDPLPDCFAVPAIYSAGNGLHSHWLRRPPTLCGGWNSGIREPFSFPRKTTSRMFPVLFICFKMLPTWIWFEKSRLFWKHWSTKVFLNVYDCGPSQFETKWMCIKIFPLG